MARLSQLFDDKSKRERPVRRQARKGSLFTDHPMVVCAACAALAVVFVLAYVAQVNARAEEARADILTRYGGEQVEVCVATKDVAAGEVIDASCITTRAWVADLLPKGALRLASEVVGRTATSAIIAGEVFCEGRFLQQQTNFQVPEGMVALSVPAKEVQAVGGAIEPGMLIDIYATGSSATALIGADVEVLATSRQPGGVDGVQAATGTSSIQWITVALSPDRVEETVAAAQSLALYFTLPGEGIERAMTEDRSAQAAPEGEFPDTAAVEDAPDGAEQEGDR